MLNKLMISENFDKLFKAAKKSNLPEGVFQFMHLDHESTSKIIADNRIDHVLFTGSVSGGRQVKKAIGERFINAGLELGGKDPAYVRKDCNLQHAIENLADGSFYNSGQSCCGIERIYVDSEIYDDFVDGIKNFTEKYILDDPSQKSTNQQKNFIPPKNLKNNIMLEIAELTETNG